MFVSRSSHILHPSLSANALKQMGPGKEATRAGERARWVKALDAKPDNPSSIPGTDTVEREN